MMHEFEVRVGDKVRIGERIIATVVEIGRVKVRIGIAAPPEILILRGEVSQDAGVRVSSRGGKFNG